MPEEKKNTYLTLHKNFVRTDIAYTDKATGQEKTFNSVTLPKGTVIEGVDVSYYQFSPLFVNPSKYRGENYYDIPLLTNREVWLTRSVLDEEGEPVLDEAGRPAKDTIRVMPGQIKDALDTARREYAASRAKETGEQSLTERASRVREGAGAIASRDIPFETRTR